MLIDEQINQSDKLKQKSTESTKCNIASNKMMIYFSDLILCDLDNTSTSHHDKIINPIKVSCYDSNCYSCFLICFDKVHTIFNKCALFTLKD